MSRTTVVLADDHAIVRLGIRSLLQGVPDLRIVGETGDGFEAVRLVERLQPDVLILDLMMPGLNGLEVARQVSRSSPQTRIVVFTMHANDAYVSEALRSGVTGYVLKGSQIADLPEALKEVTAGRCYLIPPLSERSVATYLEQAGAGALDMYHTLTNREQQVLRLAAEGLHSADIALRLSISPRTAEAHRSHAMRKLGLHTQTDLVLYAVRRGIISME